MSSSGNFLPFDFRLFRTLPLTLVYISLLNLCCRLLFPKSNPMRKVMVACCILEEENGSTPSWMLQLLKPLIRPRETLLHLQNRFIHFMITASFKLLKNSLLASQIWKADRKRNLIHIKEYTIRGLGTYSSGFSGIGNVIGSLFNSQLDFLSGKSSVGSIGSSLLLLMNRVNQECLNMGSWMHFPPKK